MFSLYFDFNAIILKNKKMINKNWTKKNSRVIDAIIYKSNFQL